MWYNLSFGSSPSTEEKYLWNTLASGCPALPQQVRELQGAQVLQFSLSWLETDCAPFRCVILKIYYPFWFLPSHLHSWLLASPFCLSVFIFASPLGCAGSLTSVVNFPNHGLVAFQPSVTSEDFSAQRFWLFPLIMGQEQAGHERADVCGGGSAHPQPGARLCLAWCTAQFYT